MDVFKVVGEKVFKVVGDDVVFIDPNIEGEWTICPICDMGVKKLKHFISSCPHCGWRISGDEEEFNKNYGITHPMLVSLQTARKQFAQGVSFKATFEEFIKGLWFYSEMAFTYNNKEFGVCLHNKRNTMLEDDFFVEFFEDNVPESLEYFDSVNDFKEKAHINGRLLKDIWGEVVEPRFML